MQRATSRCCDWPASGRASRSWCWSRISRRSNWLRWRYSSVIRLTTPSLASRSSALSKARQYISMASSVRYIPARFSARVRMILVSLELTRTARRRASRPSSDRPSWKQS